MSDSGTTAREAVAEDAAVIADLGRETYTHYFSNIWSPAELAAILERDFDQDVLISHLANPDRHSYLLLEFEGKAVGFARVNWQRHVPLSDAVGAELQKIYFKPDFTGRGLGSKLLEEVIALTRRRNDPLLWLDVLTTNSRAHTLYEHHGFVTIGKMPFKTEIVDIGMHVMVRREQPA